jgi:hypothetical protein
MLKFFERLLEPTEPPPDAPPPTLDSPHAVWRFYWHFVRQIPGPVLALFTTGFFVAITDARPPRPSHSATPITAAATSGSGSGSGSDCGLGGRIRTLEYHEVMQTVHRQRTR